MARAKLWAVVPIARMPATCAQQCGLFNRLAGLQLLRIVKCARTQLSSHLPHSDAHVVLVDVFASCASSRVLTLRNLEGIEFLVVLPSPRTALW
jgi:hypothetical protein